MRHRALLGLLIPVACSLVFVRLGFWQLSRHRERAEFNRELTRRLAESPVALESLPSAPEAMEWRRVKLEGRFRYDLERALAGRTNAGSPGVHLITPLERAGNDTLVIVTRGWVYSPDAAAVDLARWPEAESVALTGYVLSLRETGPPPSADPRRPLRALNRVALAQVLGRPIAMAHVVMTSDSAARAASVPRRLELPVPDAGPHLSYMLQWFAFAIIAVVGGILLYRRTTPAA